MSYKLHPTLKSDSFILGNFELCQLLLIDDCQYPWFVLVPRLAEIKEIYQLCTPWRLTGARQTVLPA